MQAISSSLNFFQRHDHVFEGRHGVAHIWSNDGNCIELVCEQGCLDDVWGILNRANEARSKSVYGFHMEQKGRVIKLTIQPEDTKSSARDLVEFISFFTKCAQKLFEHMFCNGHNSPTYSIASDEQQPPSSFSL